MKLWTRDFQRPAEQILSITMIVVITEGDKALGDSPPKIQLINAVQIWVQIFCVSTNLPIMPKWCEKPKYTDRCLGTET